MRNSNGIRFGGMVTTHPLVHSWPFSSLRLYDDRIEFTMFLWRKRTLPRDSVWKMSPGEFTMFPFIWRPFIEIHWFEEGKHRRLFFVRARRRKLIDELSGQGWPIAGNGQ